jgi:hypothetical protein
MIGVLAISAALLTSDTVRYLLVLPHDWAMLTELPERLADGRLYEVGAGYHLVWAPMAAWFMAYAIVPLGYSFWLGLHLAALVLLRNRALIALSLISHPVWLDTIIGNSFTFVFVAGMIAIQGSRAGALTYLALSLLLPRPVQAPLALWILWRRPDTRLPFAAMAAIVIAATVWSGYAEQWIAAVLPFAGASYDNPANFGPTNLLGAPWFVVGIPLAWWLTLKGRNGLAGLAVSPYLLPQYFLVLLWELRLVRRGRV